MGRFDEEDSPCPDNTRFGLGQTVITRLARATLTPEDVIAALGSHVVGDWGELDDRRLRDNEHAVDEDGPVVSAHRSTAAGTTFYVVTTADRSETTVFSPPRFRSERGLWRAGRDPRPEVAEYAAYLVDLAILREGRMSARCRLIGGRDARGPSGRTPVKSNRVGLSAFSRPGCPARGPGTGSSTFAALPRSRRTRARRDDQAVRIEASPRRFNSWAPYYLSCPRQLRPMISREPV